MKVYDIILGLLIGGILIVINPDVLSGKVVIVYPENLFIGGGMIFIGVVLVLLKLKKNSNNE